MAAPTATLDRQAICDRAADAIAAVFDPAKPPLTGIVIGAGDGELSSSLLVNLPQMSFWLIDQWKETVAIVEPTSGEGDAPESLRTVKAADHIREVESKTAFAHDRRRVVNLTSSQAERRCPFRSIELVVIDGMRESSPVSVDAIASKMVEQLSLWGNRLRASGKRFATSPAGDESETESSEPSESNEDAPRCAIAYVDDLGRVVFYPGNE